jgi:tellurite resistance protein TerC
VPAFPALPALHTLPALPAFPATTGALPYAAPEASPALTSIAGPTLWWVTIARSSRCSSLDFLITRRPHEVTMKRGLGWSAFYIAIPVAFGVWIWQTYGGQTGLEYYTGYLVEKSLSVDNLFIFLLLLTAFAVPRELQQRVLLIGVIGALILRGIFIALGAQLIATFSWAFLLFGAVLLATAVKVGATPSRTPTRPSTSARSARCGSSAASGRSPTPTTAPPAVRLRRPPGRSPRWRWSSSPSSPPTSSSPSTRCRPSTASPKTPTWSSPPTPSPCSACAPSTSSSKVPSARCAHLGHGLAAILAFIGVKLVLHWAHGVWTWVPEIPTLVSLGVIVAILATVTGTSLVAARKARYAALPGGR